MQTAVETLSGMEAIQAMLQEDSASFSREGQPGRTIKIVRTVGKLPVFGSYHNGEYRGEFRFSSIDLFVERWIREGASE